MFSEKTQANSKINLVKDNKIITKDQEVADTLNSFLKNAVPNLGINEDTGFTQTTEGIIDPIDAAIHKFEKHPSILKIKEVVGDTENMLNFSDTEQKEIEQDNKFERKENNNI